MRKFDEVTAHIEQALSAISYEELDISDEVQEQVVFHSRKFPLPVASYSLSRSAI